MTQEQIEELKRLAEAATPGPWSCYVGVLRECNNSGKPIATIYRAFNSQYIAAANPAAILALIAERDELSAKLDRAQSDIRALESKLFDATTKPIRICEACATYPCKCE